MPEMGFKSEWEFTNAVIELAKGHGWIPFHIPRRAYENAKIPAGFPDLMLRRRDEAGRSSLIFAELKTNDKETSIVREPQQEFLEDLAQHVPTFVFRYQDWDYVERILRDGPPDKTGHIIEPSPEVIRSDPWLPPQRSLFAIVYDLVEDIENLSTGKRAELRRMDPDAPDAAAFWRLLAYRELLGNPTLERKWALILHGIALMTGTADRRSAHDGSMPVGQALFFGGDARRTAAFYSETRLNRLLTARGPMLRVLLARLFRMLAAANQPFNWREMTSFILNDGYNEKQAEAARRGIARTYYQAERRNAPQSTD